MVITKGHVAGGGGALVIGSGALGATLLNLEDGEVMHSGLIFLIAEKNFLSQYSDNESIGRKIGWYLVSGEFKNNVEWWKKTYESWKQDANSNSSTLSNEFGKGKVESAYSPKDSKNENADKALNKVCESVYKMKMSDIGTNSTGNDKYIRYKNLLKYCSPLGQIPVSIYTKQEDTNNYNSFNNSYASNTAKSDYFVSVLSSENDLFWQLKDQEFFGTKRIIGTGSNLKESDSPLLYKLYLEKDKYDRRSVKSVCEEIYKMDESNTTEKYSVFSNHCNLYIWHVRTDKGK